MGFRPPVRPWSGRLDLKRQNSEETLRENGECEGSDTPQKRLEIPSEGGTGTQAVTPVTKTEPLTALQHEGLTLAIRDAHEQGRHLHAEALEELLVKLDG